MDRHLLLIKNEKVLRLDCEDVDSSKEHIPDSFIYEGELPYGSTYLWDSINNIPIADEGKNKIEAMELKIIEIGKYTKQKESEPWYYAPKDANFFLDNDFATKAKVRNKNDDSVWKTADKETNGIKAKKVTFTKQELSDYSDATIDRGEFLLGVKEFHIDTIQDIYLNSNKTSQDILSYDFTTGWE